MDSDSSSQEIPIFQKLFVVSKLMSVVPFEKNTSFDSDINSICNFTMKGYLCHTTLSGILSCKHTTIFQNRHPGIWRCNHFLQGTCTFHTCPRLSLKTTLQENDVGFVKNSSWCV
eukprot:UN22717